MRRWRPIIRSPLSATVSSKVPISALLSAATDPDGDSISFVSVATVSAQNGTAGRSGNWVLYEPPAGFTGSDSFTWVMRVSEGDQKTGGALSWRKVNLAVHRRRTNPRSISFPSRFVRHRARRMRRCVSPACPEKLTRFNIPTAWPRRSHGQLWELQQRPMVFSASWTQRRVTRVNGITGPLFNRNERICIHLPFVFLAVSGCVIGGVGAGDHELRFQQY